MFLFIFCFIKLGKMFAPGTNVNAEVYDVEMNSTLLIQKMLFFKKIHPNYNVPEESAAEDFYLKENNEESIIYFYYKPENQIIIISIEPDIAYKTKSKVFFKAINQGIYLGNWKDINHDYDFKESQKEKEKFEERILKPLNVVYHKRSFLEQLVF